MLDSNYFKRNLEASQYLMIYELDEAENIIKDFTFFEASESLKSIDILLKNKSRLNETQIDILKTKKSIIQRLHKF